MSVYFQFKNLDRVFDDALNEKFIVNDVDGTDPDVKSYIDSLLFKHQNGNNLSHVPTCNCGDLKGSVYLGQVCAVCSTEVVKEYDEDLSYLVWLERPDGVEKLISPHAMEVLLKRYKFSKPSIYLLEYIIDTNYRIVGRNKNRGNLDALDLLMKNRGLKRGYNNFVKHFDEFIVLLEENFGKGKKSDKAAFIDWVMRNKKNMFSNYLPIVNRSLFVIENVGGTKFYDKDMVPAVDAVRRYTGIDIRDHNSTQKQNRAAKGLIDLASFYPNYAKNTFYGKKAAFRRLISRVKSHATARTVIVSNTRVCNYDEIMLPRTAAMALLRPMLLKGLRELKGYSIKGAVNHVALHEEIYSQDIDDVLQAIVASTRRGLPMTAQRPPELHRGSIQQMFAGIKSDPNDNTTSVPLGCCRAFNADFDGDMFLLYLLLTRKIIKHMSHFALHHSVLSMRGPNRFSGVSALTKTVCATIGNWIEE